MMRTTIFSALIATSLVGPALASEDKSPEHYGVNSSQVTGMTDAQIRTQLEEQGYKVLRIERERNEVEAYAKKDGRRWEIEVDPKSGRILELEEKY